MSKIQSKFVIALLVMAIAGCGGTVSDAQFVAKAEEYLDGGDLNAASIELKNALQQNPDNERARWLLGKLNLEIGAAPAAEKELRRALGLGVVKESVLPLLAQALLMQGRYQEILDLSPDEISAGDRRSQLLTTQGLAQLALGQMAEAESTIELALESSGESVYALTAKARLQETKQEYPAAMETVQKALSLNPKYAPAWNLLGTLEAQRKELAKAEEAYIQAVDNRYNNYSDRVQLALVRIELEKYEAAQRDIDILLKQAPKQPDANFAQALMHYRKERLSDASDSLELAVKGGSNQVRAYYLMALTQFRLGNRAQAERYGRQYVLVAPGSIAGRKLVAQIEIERGNYQTAEKLIRPVVDFDGEDIEALNLLAVTSSGQGKREEMVALLRRVVELKPDSSTAQLRLGAGLLAMGQKEQGLVHVNKALEISPDLQIADILLITYYLDQKELDLALAAAEAYRGRHPDSINPYNMLGRVYALMDRDGEATEAFEAARKISPEDPTANQGLATLAIKMKEHGKAREYYESILSRHEGHLSTLLSLATLDALDGDEQGMVDSLRRAIAANPRAIQPRTMLARYYLEKGRPEQVLPLLADLDKVQRDNPPVLIVLAMSQLDQNQYPDARISLERLLEIQPDSSQAHFLLAKAHAGLDNRDSMKSELQRSVELDPANFRARLALARLLLREKDDEGATEQLQKLTEMQPDHPGVLRLKASLALRRGEREEASDILADVFYKSPSSSNMLSVALLKWNAGDREGALEMQEQWLTEHPQDVAVAQALAEGYLEQNNVKRANQAYSMILERDDDSVVALNNLAWNLRDSDPPQALEYAQRAYAIAPETPGVMDTLAVVYLRTGDTERARRMMERALEKSPADPTFRYHHAMIEAAAGNQAAAINILGPLLDEDAPFKGRAEAEKLLWELKAGN